MLRLIVTGRAAELGRFRAATIAIAAHASVVLAAISSRSALPVQSHHAFGAIAPLERVRFIVTRSSTPEARPSRAKSRRGPVRAAKPTNTVPALALSIPTAAPDTASGIDNLDLTTKVADTADFKPRTLAEAIGASLVNGRASAPSPDGVYRPDAVDRIVTPLADNPKPIYPRALEASHVEADFTVMFVVDSTGRVDPGSLEVPGGVHRLFADAVRYALMRSRYLPAQLAGRPVRQLVSQEFIFRMAR
jgi:Gram-negative bacterial TonB protein C-terminal